MLLPTPRTLRSAAILFACAASAAAQGGDDCSNPQGIVGSGPFTYDTLTATTDGPSESFWSTPGLDNMDNDVWFFWQAPKTAVYEISNCVATNTFATFMAVYEFGCSPNAGRAFEARDFGCGKLSFTTFQLGAQAGSFYLIRIGHSVPQNRDVGTFTIVETSGPGILGSAVNPANGRTYHFLEPSSWGVAQAAARMLGGDLVTVNDQAENDWIQGTFSNWGEQPRDLWLGYNDAAFEGVWNWVSGESPGYENWSTGEPNNNNEYEHYAHLRRDWANGSWNDNLGYPRAGFFYSDVHGLVEIKDAPLTGTPSQISLSSGGSQNFTLDLGPGEAGNPYLLVGTLSGTMPGTPFGGFLVPLNVDAYTLYTLTYPGQLPLSGSLGFLDAAGKATASLTFPAGQLTSLAGQTMHHAFATFIPGGPDVVTVSNAVPVALVP